MVCIFLDDAVEWLFSSGVIDIPLIGDLLFSILDGLYQLLSCDV